MFCAISLYARLLNCSEAVNFRFFSCSKRTNNSIKFIGASRFHGGHAAVKAEPSKAARLSILKQPGSFPSKPFLLTIGVCQCSLLNTFAFYATVMDAIKINLNRCLNKTECTRSLFHCNGRSKTPLKYVIFNIDYRSNNRVNGNNKIYSSTENCFIYLRFPLKDEYLSNCRILPF